MSQLAVTSRFNSSAKFTRLMLPVLVALLSASCGNVLQVTRVKAPLPPAPTKEECDSGEKNCDLPGVPFYVVGHRCSHASSWLRPLYVVTVTVTTADEAKTVKAVVVKVLGFTDFENPSTQAVIRTLKSTAGVTSCEDKLTDFRALPDTDLSLCHIKDEATKYESTTLFDQARLPSANSCEARNTVQNSNLVLSERYVDASTIYFQNVKMPPTGSASSEVDLDGDGVLNKSSAQVENKLLEDILSTIGTLGAAALGIPAAAAGVAPTPAPPPAVEFRGQQAPPPKYNFDVQIETHIYRYTHWAPEPAESGNVRPPCRPDPTLVGQRGEVFSSTFEEVVPGAAPGDDAKAGKKAPANPKK